MKTVPDTLTGTGTPESGPQRGFLMGLLRTLMDQFGLYGFRLNRVLPKDGTEPMQAPLPLMTYTLATVPAASTAPAGLIFVSDAGAGSRFWGSDGTSWHILG